MAVNKELWATTKDANVADSAVLRMQHCHWELLTYLLTICEHPIIPQSFGFLRLYTTGFTVVGSIVSLLLIHTLASEKLTGSRSKSETNIINKRQSPPGGWMQYK